jgi:hypothetical protein
MSQALSRFPAAFVAAAAAPAFLAGLHVVLLAVPVHSLLGRRRTPGPVLVLASSFLIGGLPLPLLFGAEALSDLALILGLFGLSGGFAFLLMTGPREEFEDPA